MLESNLSGDLFSSEHNFRAFESDRLYDVIIIGGGPAGFTAAVYCMRKGLSTGLIAQSIGGQMADTAGIENYLGFRYIDGLDLVDKFRDQVLQFGIAFTSGTRVKAIFDGEIKSIQLEDDQMFSAKTLIVASGKEGRKLGVPGEVTLIGHGVSYCPICDAPFFAGKRVAVIGGGNSAAEAVIDLAKLASHVTVIQNLPHLTADKILLDKLKVFKDVSYLYGHEVKMILGTDRVTGAIVKDKATGGEHELELDGIFVQIGLDPHSGFAKGVLEMNELGEIVVDCYCRTSRAGIFAAGDVTSVPFKQIIIACGEGAKAALSATDYILKKFEV